MCSSFSRGPRRKRMDTDGLMNERKGMCFRLWWWWTIGVFILSIDRCSCMVTSSSSSSSSVVLELPTLILHSDQKYLIKKHETRMSCQISPGWPDARLSKVQWLKNGDLVKKLEAKQGGDDLEQNGPTLRVLNGQQQSEGDYQCIAMLRDVKLANKQMVDVKLISAPVKFRRARITKFDRVSEETVRVMQGQVARLPCLGMPDSIPSAQLWFERQGSMGVRLGMPGDSRYLATPTAMQIALAQPSDSGKYLCVVQNTIINQTRQSNKAILLIVQPMSPAERSRPPNFIPHLSFPDRASSLDSPIVVNVVAGQMAILECVAGAGRVVWEKANSTLSPIMLTDDRARVRQVWGNLRIRTVSLGDAGVYICHGVSPFATDDVLAKAHPRAFYRLSVHAATSVRLQLEPLMGDRSWLLSCLASNQHYEIPMVYVNGDALVDAKHLIGSTDISNFYRNPINVTLQSSTPLTGSVQCLSRPAMEEAEIYGHGLERGRAMNVYVFNRALAGRIDLIIRGPENATRQLGSTVQLMCLVLPQATRTRWHKDNKPLLITDRRISLIGTGTLEIAEITAEDQGWYTCTAHDNRNHHSNVSAYLTVATTTTTRPSPIVPVEVESEEDDFKEQILPVERSLFSPEAPRAFVSGRSVRVQWSLDDDHSMDQRRLTGFKVQFKRDDPKAEWITGEQVGSHVRATTVKFLVGDYRYQFRIGALLNDGSVITSATSVPVTIVSDKTVTTTATLPPEPQDVKLTLPTSTSMRVSWTHRIADVNAAADYFLVLFSKSELGDISMKTVNTTETEVILDGLSASTEYRVTVIAENSAGQSQSTPSMYLRTLGISSLSRLIISIETGTIEHQQGLLALLNRYSSSMDLRFVVILVVAVVISSLLLLICCMIGCNLRDRHAKKVAMAARGRFTDTSHRIFNEQRVHRARLLHHNNENGSIYRRQAEDINGDEELIPLQHNNPNLVEQRPISISSAKSSPFVSRAETIPNFYGPDEDDTHLQHSTVDALDDDDDDDHRISSNYNMSVGHPGPGSLSSDQPRSPPLYPRRRQNELAQENFSWADNSSRTTSPPSLFLNLKDNADYSTLRPTSRQMHTFKAPKPVFDNSDNNARLSDD